MESKPQPSANTPPPKPWERAGSSSGPAPFNPPSAGRTSDVVEASGTARPGEIVSSSDNNAIVNTNSLGRAVPTRPWEHNYGNSSHGGYGSTMNYNSVYGSGTYGSGAYGSYGGLGGMYGNNIYRGGYSGLHGSSGMYGGGMYNSGLEAKWVVLLELKIQMIRMLLLLLRQDFGFQFFRRCKVW
ncbi:peroxisomal membrane protein 13-like [Quillaja saponaria]|uniref:Peroxisomal membrane protein 13-like n=1 Tax=Quillaja saponaria TaxID=32244 RepID=A0AAD7KWR4_QUISA|nr:peroxisomal membrane protein 13-like [Quillaja saponaria]